MQRCGLITSVIALALLTTTANGGTKELFFGWEDGTSTALGEFISGGSASVTYANVTSGFEVDYGPSDDPFVTPQQYDVMPIEGNRMLEINTIVDDTRSNAVNPFLAYVENLDAGDIVQFSFKSFDPSEDRSPSVLVSGTYAQNGNIDSFAGFFTPFQSFPPGSGWLEIVADAAPDGVTFPVDPNLVFDEGTQGDREAVVMRATTFRPTLSTIPSGGSGTYKFFIDDLRIQVTSNNPLAQITLPDGSVTLVNSTTAACDLDGDGDCDVTDLRQLYDHIASGTATNADIGPWLADAGVQNGKTYLPGDTDLDGSVGGGDFTTVASSFGGSGLPGAYWDQGNFDGNVGGNFDVGGGDFTALASNFGSTSVTAVPEPAGCCLMMAALAGLGLVRRRR